ncbi:MAG: DUF5666 domain-containing protein [Acidiferrobacter sp.]
MSLTATFLRRVTLIGLLMGLISGFAGPRGGIGGTGAARGGIGGTGITAIGVIQRFGSIYVNGAEYLLSLKTRYWVDGRRASVDALHRGQNVFVDAFRQGGRPTAGNVRVQHALIGLVQAVAANGRQVRILGQTIQVSARALAHLEHTEHTHPALGMDLAVSAGSPASGRWIATRIRALPQPHDGPVRFLIRGTLHIAGRHRITLAKRSFLWVGPRAPKNLVGRYVVAQGYYRLGHPAVSSLRPATGLKDAQAHISITGYTRRAHGVWRFDGQALIAHVGPAPNSAHRPTFLTVRREGSDRFVVLRAIPDIHVMSFGLHLPDKAAEGVTRPQVMHPGVTRPQIMRPAMTRPQVLRPMVTRPQTAPPPMS